MKDFYKFDKYNFFDIINLIAFLFIVVGAVYIIYFLVTTELNSCTSDPLRYAADKIAREENANYTKIFLSIYDRDIPIKLIEINLEKENKIIKIKK